MINSGTPADMNPPTSSRINKSGLQIFYARVDSSDLATHAMPSLRLNFRISLAKSLARVPFGYLPAICNVCSLGKIYLAHLTSLI